jgi:hypothetical protein
LYADTVVGLRAIAADSRAEGFLAAYRARKAILDGVLVSLAASQQMRAAERVAVCEVLAALLLADPSQGVSGARPALPGGHLDALGASTIRDARH